MVPLERIALSIPEGRWVTASRAHYTAQQRHKVIQLLMNCPLLTD